MGGHRTALLAAVLLGAVAAAAGGHFHTFWPGSAAGYGRLGDGVHFSYFWGHPYEMILFDAAEPRVSVHPPGSEPVEVKPQATIATDPETGTKRRTFAWAYVPQTIGDHWVVLQAAPYPVEETGEAVQDYVKQCLHVMAETGWERRLGLPIELVPLTRPYGLEPGVAFRARAYLDGRPLPGAPVEIEKFNGFHVPAEELPTDEFGNEDVPMITRTVLTDDDGYLVCTLDEAGWWMVSVSAQGGTVETDGGQLRRILRGGLWVAVREPFTQKP